MKRTLLFTAFSIALFLGSTAFFMYALAYTEKTETIYTASFAIGAEQQLFRAFCIHAPSEGFFIKFNVSNGNIKFSEFTASQFEDSLGYFDVYVNETTVEKVQYWLFEGSNETVGVSAVDVGIWYLQFYNEDSYEKEVSMQITKFWHAPIYQDWIT